MDIRLPPRPSTRRQVIAGAVTAIGGLAAMRESHGQTSPQSAPAAAVNKNRTWLHQEVSFKASPQRIYLALMDAKQFAALTGLSAEIDPKEGGAFTTFGSLIAGRNVELIQDQRIVQAWRPNHWDPGVYSIVRFELKPKGAETLVALDHTGFPEGEFDSLSTGWKPRYWDPMRKFLG